MSYDLYILGVRSTINKKETFLKRILKEIFINNYMTNLIKFD